MAKCVKCGGQTAPIDQALTKKLINRGTEDYLCMQCLCSHFRQTESFMLRKAAQFQRSGCTLFGGLKIELPDED